MIPDPLVGARSPTDCTFSREDTAPTPSPSRVRLPRILPLAVAVVLLTGCEGFMAQKAPSQEPAPVAPAPPPLPSAEPIVDVASSDILFAQKTLNKLGYNAGVVDGIWGPQSARAVRNFEKKYQLQTANGLLSELNLFMLEKISNTSRTESTAPAPARSESGITAKLDLATPLGDAPQLVILERRYSMLAKPNPFSEEIAVLDPGTGIYVIGEQEGWYEVESDDKLRGFVKAD